MSIILITLISSTIGAALILVVIYNHQVNLAHNVSLFRIDIERMEVENAELKEKTFDLFASEHLQTFANERLLVKDRMPQYVRVDY